jgi:Undecaprenyl-phosphate galactose phosphotransferase WbaP
METETVDSTLTLSTDILPASISVRPPLATIGALIVSDVLAVLASTVCASLLRNLLLNGTSAPITSTVLAALILTLCSLTGAGLYPGTTLNPVEELRRSTLSITLGFLALWSSTFFLRDLSESRLLYLLDFSMALFMVPGLRSLTRSMFATRRWWGCPAIILGYGAVGKMIHRTLAKNAGIGLKPIAVLDDDPSKYLDVEQSMIRGPISRCLELASSETIPYGIICMPGLTREQLLRVVEQYEHCFGHLIVIPNVIGMTSLGVNARDLGGVIGLEVTRQLLRPSARIAKRCLDLLLTMMLAPLVCALTAICAILIKLEDGGPVFYANERIGFRGKLFKPWKMRSMVLNADQKLEQHLAEHPEEAEEWRRNQKLKVDPRVTRVGKWLRKTSLDELPQFWNVLIGEMSVVGPRPMLQNQVALYGSSINLYCQVRPGITGLWQVSGRNKLTFSDRVTLDKYVIQNWSVWLDVYILSRTAKVVLFAEGAY